MSHWLTGRRVVVTRAETQAQDFCERLRALGAKPIAFPVIAIVASKLGGPLDQAIARLNSYHWVIFTSVNAVEHFWARLTGQEIVIGAKIAAVGPTTAEALCQRGAAVHLVPGEYRAEALLDEIGDVTGQRILLPCADIARPTLAEGLRAMDAHVDRVVAYHTVLGEPAPTAFDALRAGVDVVTFASSSSARNFVALTDDVDYGKPLIACIGPLTAATARAQGLNVDVIAQEYTLRGLIQALKGHNAQCQGHSAQQL